MKTQVRKGTQLFLGLLAITVLGLAFLPSEAGAKPKGPPPVTPPPTCTVATVLDTDCDGFIDTLESGTGVILDQGTAAAVTFLPCDGILDRADCVKFDEPDLFVILVPAIGGIGTLIPAVNPLEFVSARVSEGGLGIATHVINIDQAKESTNIALDRQLTSVSPQKAVKITEDNTTPFDPNIDLFLGFGEIGGPNGFDEAGILTLAIKEFVEFVYREKPRSGTSQDPPAGLIPTYIKHVLAHEIGHVIDLTLIYDDEFGGNHYCPGCFVVMEQSVKYTVKKDTIKFFVSTTWESGDETAFCLNKVDVGGNCLSAQ